jgi:tRNA G10  N-methylase Trm11
MTETPILSCFYLVNRKANTLDVAQAEAERLSDGVVVASGLVEGAREVTSSDGAYIRYGAELLVKDSSIEAVCERISAMDLVAERFRIVVERIPGKLPMDRCKAEKAVADSIQGLPDLTTPAVEFLLVATMDGVWFGRMLPRGDRTWERFRHKPFPYCHALPVELALASVNLTAESGDLVFDPCCGSGTILLAAVNRGLRAMGCDINRQVAYHALRNAKHFGCDMEIWSGDGSETNRTADCIVTNLAYDRRCHISDEAVHGLLRNFRGIAKRVTVVTAQDIRDVVADLGYTIEQRIPSSTHSITRWVYVMQSQ